MVTSRTSLPAAVTLGERVRASRLRRGWSQEQLAEASGLHWTYVGQVERGTRNVTLRTLVTLAAALEVDPAKLVAKLRP